MGQTYVQQKDCAQAGKQNSWWFPCNISNDNNNNRTQKCAFFFFLTRDYNFMYVNNNSNNRKQTYAFFFYDKRLLSSPSSWMFLTQKILPHPFHLGSNFQTFFNNNNNNGNLAHPTSAEPKALTKTFFGHIPFLNKSHANIQEIHTDKTQKKFYSYSSKHKKTLKKQGNKKW